jgi:hypothetical protein
VARKLERIAQEAESSHLLATEFESTQSNYDRLRQEMTRITQMLVERAQKAESVLPPAKEDLPRARDELARTGLRRRIEAS